MCRKAAVRMVLEQLEKMGVRWCGYKGYEEWMEDGDGDGDIDLAVHPEDIDAAREAISGAAWAVGGRAFVWCSGHADVAAGFIVLDGGTVVEVDCMTQGWWWNGVRIADAREVVERRRRWRGLWIAAPEDEWVLTLHLYVWGGGVTGRRKERAVVRVRELYQQNSKKCVERIEALWGEESVQRIGECVEGEAGDLRAMGWRLRKVAMARGWRYLFHRLWVMYVGRPWIMRQCGMWKGYGRGLRPVRQLRTENEGLARWADKVVRQHPGSWKR